MTNDNKKERYEPLSQQQANKIYDLLVEHVGARESYRDEFVTIQTSFGGITLACDFPSHNLPREFGYKFMRGMHCCKREGTKSYFSHDYVGIHKESETEELVAAAHKASKAISEYRKVV